MNRPKHSQGVLRLVSPSVLFLLLPGVGGCTPAKTNDPPTTRAEGQSRSQLSPQASLADRLAVALRNDEDRQKRLTVLLQKRNSTLEILVADLMNGIHDTGVQTEEALKRLARPPKDAPWNELAKKYQYCAQVKVHIRVLTEALEKGRIRILEMRRAEDHARVKAQLADVLNPAEQKAAEALLAEAGINNEFNPETIMQTPDKAADMDSAYRQLNELLRRSKSDARTSTSGSTSRPPQSDPTQAHVPQGKSAPRTIQVVPAETPGPKFETIVSGVYIKALGVHEVQIARNLEASVKEMKLRDRPRHPKARNTFSGNGLFVCLPDGHVFEAQGYQSCLNVSLVAEKVLEVQRTRDAIARGNGK